MQLPLAEPKLARLELQVQPENAVSFGPLTAPMKVVLTKNGLIVAVTETATDEDIAALEAGLKEVCQ